MQLSIGKLAALSISLLIIVAIITTGAGIHVLQNHRQAAQTNHETAARDIVQNAAIALRDLVRFYQGKPQLGPVSPNTGNLPGPSTSHDFSLQSRTAQKMLDGLLRRGDRFQVLDEQGLELLSVGNPTNKPESVIYQAQIPDTAWQLVLHRPEPRLGSSLTGLVAFDTLALLTIGILVISMVRVILQRFRSDLTLVHAALGDVLAGRYEAKPAPTSLDEVSALYPQIEQLAHKIQHQQDKLGHHSLTDSLTGLFNRRYFDLMLAHLHEQSERHLPATLAIIDLNDFHRINVQFGRTRGDRVLQNMAGYLLSRVRSTDIVVRLGGDQFGLLLTNMAGETLDDWLAALVHDYDHQALEDNENGKVFCQFSVGVARIDVQAHPLPTAVFNAADSAMYAVKQRRNIHHSRYAIARQGNVTALRPRKETR